MDVFSVQPETQEWCLFETDEGGIPASPAQGASEQTPPQDDSGIESLLNLDDVPEDYRPYVEPHLKQVQSNVEGKFREAAEFRKQWEPFGELGLTDYDPEDIQQLLEFADIASDDNTFKEWWTAVGEEKGFMEGLGEPQEPGMEEPEFDPDEVGGAEQFTQAVAQTIDEKLAPIMDQFRSQEQQTAIANAEQHIETELETIKAEHKEKYGEEPDEDVICRLALAYEGPQSIRQGYEDFLGIVGNAETGVVTRRNSGPEVPEGSGPADTTTVPITDKKEANRIALERLRKANQG